ncbi:MULTISPECIES: type III secretion system export apparatus subunit SctS [Burkholderia]|uniref:Type III secretion protein S n=1 Tax=Burkholderia pyrrocinia TaxID=60550 RepID=A0A318HU18_BURPY|nr:MULTISPECIES: type III secretion system export apparatus subunit SctS [Burkholderia]PXX21928.1 type III secretion protein S [Burkholderia pyrrocinia]SFW89913.1 type III secretion protein S [Burkholderia sp. NFACC33-1]SFY46363.1 type III secretion protein S [Burkholderia sp. NFPP32]
MDMDTLIGYTTRGMLLCMYVSLPIVAAATLAGLAVSFLQAVTSIQDQTLSHAVKLIAATIAVMVTAPASAAAILRLATEIMQMAVPS